MFEVFQTECIKWKVKMESVIKRLQEIKCISDEVTKSLKNSPDNQAMVFADLGRFLCSNFQKIRKTEKENIFIVIEELISSNDETISTNVATMFLEAFINCWMDSGFEKEYRDFLGTNSLLFLDRLEEFYS